MKDSTTNLKAGIKRWVLLTEFFPPERGGIQTALETIVTQLGTGLTVVAPVQSNSHDYHQNKSYAIIRRSLFSGQIWPRWLWLVGWLWSRRSMREMIVFGHFSPAITAAWILHWFGFQYGILVHGQDLLSEEHRPRRRWLVGPILRRANWIGVNSAFTAQAVRRHRVPDSALVRTHPAVPDELVSMPVSPFGNRLITVCRLVERKNIETIIRAVGKLQVDWPKLQYDIVGDGPEREKLEGLVTSLNLNDRVKFHGQISESKKLELLRQATLAIMVPKILSKGSDIEGLGIFYLEAAALGLPIVASQTGGVSDAVIDNQTGQLVDPTSPSAVATTVHLLFDDSEKARSFGLAGQRLIRSEFTASVRNRRLAWLLNRNEIGSNPKVSVIIPVYNHAPTIARTLRSVISQTWSNIEIIVMNDGSTDNLEGAIEPWRRDLTYLIGPNQGAPSARNTGSRSASGDYLLFVDADTWLAPGMVEQMVRVLETHPEAAYTYSRFRFGPKGFRLHEYSYEKLKVRNYIHTSSMIRTRDFTGFDQALTRFQDWDLWLTLAEQGKSGVFIPQELFRVSQGQGGMRASTWLPRFTYRLPWLGRGHGSANIRRYREAEQVIRSKHQLV